MVTIAEGISAAGLALKAVKDLREIDRSISEADFKLKIADLTSTLADVKLAMVDLQGSMQARDDEIAQLKSSLEKRAETIEVRGFTYEQRNGKPVGPHYCDVCLQAGRFFKTHRVRGGDYACPKCSSTFHGGSEYLYPEDS